jgi:hypothetical protein
MALAVGVLFSVNLLVSAPARADVTTYLEALHKAGINRDDAEALEMGWEVCGLRELGVAPERVQDQAVQNSRSYPPDGMTLDQAAQMVRIAVDELCNKRLSPKPVAPTSNLQDWKDADRSNVDTIHVPAADRLSGIPRSRSAADQLTRA